MDQTTETITAWARELYKREFETASYELAETRLLDSLACVAGGFSSEPAQIVRAICCDAADRSTAAGTVLGAERTGRVDSAVFANTVALDYWDANDVYAVSGAGHPSDVIPALCVVAGYAHSSGKDLLKAILIGYELFGALNEAFVLRDAGWDQGTYIAAATAIGAGVLLGLDFEQLANALCLAVVPNIALRQTRAGELSMWKACATGLAASSSVLGVLLAQTGMEGPRAVFEGHHGMFEQVTGRFEIGQLLDANAEPKRISRSNLKAYPAEHHAQAAIEVAREIRSRATFDVTAITRVRIGTHAFALSEIADDVAKWRPTNKETADHSLPYLVAATLVTGSVSQRTFDAEALQSPETLRIIGVCELEEVAELTAALPGRSGAQLEVTLEDGSVHVAKRSVAKGHWSDPLSKVELEEKVYRMCEAFLADADVEALIGASWRTLEMRDANELLEAFPRISSPTSTP